MEEDIELSAGSLLAQLLGEDLSLLGGEEPQERISALRNEIGRVETMLESKKGSRDVAEALFGKSE